MTRTLLAIASLVLLLLCLPWSAIALLSVFAAGTYESDGTCYAGRPLWAIGQAVVAVAGIALAGRAALAGLGSAAANARDRPQRWLGLAYGIAALGAWVFVLAVLEPEAQSVAPERCG